MKTPFFFILAFAILLPKVLMAQEDKSGKDAINLSGSEIDKPLTIDLTDKDEKEDAALKKKVKKNVFYDVKTKKSFVKTGSNNNPTYESFHYLKDPIKPDPYVRNIYWYDFDSRKIKNTRNIDFENGVILHGPYEKYRADGVILEKGIFYNGTKHGRWTKYDKNNILIDKKKYYKGWPKESIASYYDTERKKLKEITPIENGKKEGNYYLFHDNGMVAVRGEFQNDEQVNVWIEYYKFRRRKKREVQFKKDPYTNDFKTYIIKEWNEKGELIYDRSAFQKRLN